MKVAEIENNILVVKEREDEKLDGRKGALVKVLGCGLCGSDIVKLTQHLAKDKIKRGKIDYEIRCYGFI